MKTTILVTAAVLGLGVEPPTPARVKVDLPRFRGALSV
jgi:hypothetical protein